MLASLLAARCQSSAATPLPSVPTGGDDTQYGAGTAQDAGDSSGSTATTGASGSSSLVIPLTSQDPNCQSATACPPANPNLNASTTSGILAGVATETATWNFQGVDLNSATRRVVVILTNLPTYATMTPGPNTGNLVSSVSVSWAALTAQTGNLQVILRDYDRCIVAASDNAVCNVMVYNPLFDKAPITLPYEIVNAGQALQPLNAVGSGTAAAAATCTKSNNGGLGSILGLGTRSTGC